MRAKDVVSVVFIILAILSTLLIFVISWWIVLIINFCAILLFDIIFRDIEVPYWVYFIECGLCVVIMILTMCFSDKICGGAMQFMSDYKFVKHYYSFVVEIAALTKYFYIAVGVFSFILIIFLISVGLSFKFAVKKAKESIKHSWQVIGEEMHFSFYLSIPLACMGGLVLANCPLHLFGSMFVGVGYVGIFLFIVVVESVMHNGSDGTGRDSGGGGKTYHVFIVEE